MKKIFTCLTLTMAFGQYVFGQGTWTQMAGIPFTPRWGAVGFSIGAKGYVGTGYNGSTNYGDFWEYDPLTNSWTQRASISPRRAASDWKQSAYAYRYLGIRPNHE